ncbi:MAG: P22 coat protein - protein 5 domain protein [Clostridia bacterium]|nr:P22 coat protein - protein 5 domain protein [Clostridia bacterium]
MAYSNFIPSVWSESINRELERACVFVEDCNRQYEGEVSKKGDSVHILGVGKPTIKSLERENASGLIDDAEEIDDTSVIMNINQIRYFNYKVGDIDKAQAIGGLMDALSEETSEALANEIDKFIASMALETEVAKLNESATVVTKENILSLLDDAIQALQENDVNMANGVTVTVSPRFYKLFKQAYISNSTTNAEALKNGKVAMYGNVTVKLSNNVAKSDDGATDNIMIRTKRAIAFVNPLTHTEAYRPEKSFADAVKGYALFDGKVVRPNEIININVKYA